MSKDDKDSGIIADLSMMIIHVPKSQSDYNQKFMRLNSKVHA